MGTLNSFRDLRCWQEARDLRIAVSRLAKTFPKDEKFSLTNQTLRCSRSITNNLAEGFGRFHLKDNIRFCRMAKGSYYELLDHLLIAFEEGYLDEESLKGFETQIEDGLRTLNGYIKYLNSKVTDTFKEDAGIYMNTGTTNRQQTTDNQEPELSKKNIDSVEEFNYEL